MTVQDIGDTEIRLIGTDTELKAAEDFIDRFTQCTDSQYSFGLGPDNDALVEFRCFETATQVSALLHSAKIMFDEDNDS